ncbi:MULTISPECIES: aldo/keto reductase [Mammaliicoccus]|uniref:Aldo/keto reductase n=1 Tax=Mammaliicoccus fleurettii TaxID=150056 RepID=A0ABS5MMM4_9STAP|nr:MULTISPECIES: aldo/keto reductase [Mammaliicoccus]HCN60773.1 aldo/keto reductase [Staphylococcus sp.]MBL0847145.1 aldo/keto reductase [Mammaliicoccus fleurettii]MBS3671860.1 aldo/keto reductase [Mammaliicoccus fleurettii]MBS3696887.1 aldo/keto reductase [Mammaliicoccus fleurettii]MBW0765362.1 aldo/keto reductase [Mammaliicoccus fleurettii]
MTQKLVEFYNGNSIPALGLGTFRVENNDECREAVKHAIISGYKHIDTAQTYQNEEKVGQGIKEGLEEAGLNREDLFITTKLWMSDYGRENVQSAYEASLKRLGLDYVDLYLIHWPGQDKALISETWKAMEDLYNEGKIKNIGVSNFHVNHLEELLQEASIKPVINQIECHPYLIQKDLRTYLEAQKIVAQSWSPLMNGQILEDEVVKEIANELGKTPAQVIIRWNIDENIVVIPKSVTPSRIEENLNVFDFELSDSQLSRLNALNKDERIGPDPESFTGK